MKLLALNVPCLKSKIKIDVYINWLHEGGNYKTTMNLNGNPLLHTFLKQARVQELAQQIELHQPLWYENTEEMALKLLEKYSVETDMNEISAL